MKSSNYSIMGIFWRVVLLMWPIYLLQSAWWEGSLGKLIAAIVILLFILWWAVSYGIKFYKQGKAMEAQRQAALEKAQAAQVIQEEWRRSHESIVTKVAGVTFNNDDGSSRQEYLKEAYVNKGRGAIELERYTYQGKPAIYVLYDGLCIGNIPQNDVGDVLDILDRISSTYLEVERFVSDDNEDGKTEPLYRADLVITYRK